MRRLGFHLAALALAVVIVFAPRPWGSDVSPSIGGESGVLVGRVLAPTIDAVEFREQDSARAMRQPAPTLWWICLIGIATAGLFRRTFGLTDPITHRRLVVAVDSRGCRAPPAVLA
jgi:hypothetical protein